MMSRFGFITTACVCVAYSVFCTPLSWLRVCFMGVSSCHAKIWLSVSSWGLFAQKKKGAIRYQEHTFKILADTELLTVPLIFFFLLLCRSFIRNNAPLLCRPLSRGSHTRVYTCAASSWQFVSLTCRDIVCLSCLNWIKFLLWKHQDIWSFLLYTQGHMATE